MLKFEEGCKFDIFIRKIQNNNANLNCADYQNLF